MNAKYRHASVRMFAYEVNSKAMTRVTDAIEMTVRTARHRDGRLTALHALRISMLGLQGEKQARIILVSAAERGVEVRESRLPGLVAQRLSSRSSTCRVSSTKQLSPPRGMCLVQSTRLGVRRIAEGQLGLLLH